MAIKIEVTGRANYGFLTIKSECPVCSHMYSKTINISLINNIVRCKCCSHEFKNRGKMLLDKKERVKNHVVCRNNSTK